MLLYIQQLRKESAGMLPILWAVKIIHSYTHKKDEGFLFFNHSFLPPFSSPLHFPPNKCSHNEQSPAFHFWGVKCTPGIPLSTPTPQTPLPTCISSVRWISGRKLLSHLEVKRKGEAWEVSSERSCFGCKDLIFFFIFFFRFSEYCSASTAVQHGIFTQAMRKVSFKKPKETKHHNRIVALLPIFTTSLSKLSFRAENLCTCGNPVQCYDKTPI